jgi:hypothetical protein
MTQALRASCIRVLVVEDNRDICENIGDYLTLPDKLAGFDAGADDYLVKPFALQELHARLVSLYRRGRAKTTQLLTVGDLTMDKQTLEVRRGSRKLSLNPACLKILERLMEALPAVVVRASLETLLWGDERPDSDGFYAWACRVPGARARENVRLLDRIREIHEKTARA